jgi:hypothetical protein
MIRRGWKTPPINGIRGPVNGYIKDTYLMAADFEISVTHKGANVHLDLSGNFDGSSAFELIHFLKHYCDGYETAVIHTHGLKGLHPSGLEVFRRNMCLLNGQNILLVFTGKRSIE